MWSFKSRQPEWRKAMGAAASISIPKDNVTGIVPRIADGLERLGVKKNREKQFVLNLRI